MKALFVLLLSCLCASAQLSLDGPGAGVFGQQAAGGGACNTAAFGQLAQNDITPLQAIYVGQGEMTLSADTICKVVIPMPAVIGDVTGKTFWAFIAQMTNTSYLDLTTLHTTYELSDAIAGSSLVVGDNTFTFSTPHTIDAGKPYAIGLSTDAFDVNYARVYDVADASANWVSGTKNGHLMRWDAAGVKTDEWATYNFDWTAYK